MNYIDVFNGYADGICALVQLRLAKPRPSQLVTGIKRNINLLADVDSTIDTQITVLDISFAKNASDVSRLLEQDARIDYLDHHQIVDMIEHSNLTTHIDLDPNTCTSLIVYKLLKSKYRAWAITAAFGDNLLATAMTLGIESGFTDARISHHQRTGHLT
jgi:oligoribonuclease NrnB/cAMP/cGMP phosphodiesterase (DHH superfamily)